MQTYPLRLSPGDDLRGSIEDALRRRKWPAAFVLQGIGSLGIAQLRFAGAEVPVTLCGDREILTLAGSVSLAERRLPLAPRPSNQMPFQKSRKSRARCMAHGPGHAIAIHDHIRFRENPSRLHSAVIPAR
ncbi:DNA-binding protein [Burkholderia sp. Bp9002]|nr:DNA-binding protein [Burkholderia sp. Bp9002]